MSSPCDYSSDLWKLLLDGPIGDIAEDLLGPCVRFYQSKLNFKNPKGGTEVKWHQDKPYYCVDGKQSVSFWIALDDISKDGCLECVAGSHLTNILHKPKRFNGNDLYENDHSKDVPDINSNRNKYRVRWYDKIQNSEVFFEKKTKINHLLTGT